VDQPYYAISGFDIVGSNSIADFEGCFNIYRRSHGLIISNCYFHDTPYSYSNQVLGIHFEALTDETNLCENVVVRSNRFYNLGYMFLSLFASNALVADNWFEKSNSRDAMQIFGSDIIISNNILTNITQIPEVADHTDLFQTYAQNGEYSTNVLVTHNLCINCYGCAIGQFENTNFISGTQWKNGNWTFRDNIFSVITSQASIDFKQHWYNNLFFSCTTNTGDCLIFAGDGNPKGNAIGSTCSNNVFLWCGSDPSNLERGWYSTNDPCCMSGFNADNNYVAGTNSFSAKRSGGTAHSFTEAHGINGGDPGFISISAQNFHLLASSILRNAGGTIAGSSVDFDRIARPQEGLWDIGPYEFVSVPEPGQVQRFRFLRLRP
jgi:hypothetical protein